MEEEICTCCNQIIDTVFHKGEALGDYEEFWNFNTEGWKDKHVRPTVFLGKFVDSKGEKWDIGFQITYYDSHITETTAVLVYSNEAPCYASPSFDSLDEARLKIEKYKKLDFECAEALEEMVNRALAKGIKFD